MTGDQIELIRRHIENGVDPGLSLEELKEVMEEVERLKRVVVNLLGQVADRDEDIELLKKDIRDLEEYKRKQ